jgi:hypothetical protein
LGKENKSLIVQWKGNKKWHVSHEEKLVVVDTNPSLQEGSLISFVGSLWCNNNLVMIPLVQWHFGGKMGNMSVRKHKKM